MKITLNTDVLNLIGLSKREKKKMVNHMSRAVMKNRTYRKQMKNVSKKTSKAVARSMVSAMVEQAAAKQEEAHKTPLERYTQLVTVFARIRKKRVKIKYKREGKPDPRTGLIKLQKLKKAPKSKKAKAHKRYHVKK